MIIFYAIPDDSKAARLREIIDEDKIEHLYVPVEAAGQTLGTLFAGDTSAKPHPDQTLPVDPGIIFNAADISHEDATKILNKFADNDIVFGYQVLADESMMGLALGDILIGLVALLLAADSVVDSLIGHRDYQQFLAKLSFLQQMIDGCAALKENLYDQDKWSALKIAIANGNDFLDAVVSDTDSEFDKIDPKDIDNLIANLQTAMKNLLN